MKREIIRKILYFILILAILVVAIYFGIRVFDLKRSSDLKDVTFLENHIKIVDSSIGSSVKEVLKDQDMDIYDMNYQNVISEKINDLLLDDYTPDKPLIVYNPYGTNNNSVNVYFETEEPASVSYTIKVKGFDDFTRNLKNDGDDNYTLNHSYQIMGFILGHKNELELKVTNEDGDSKTYNFKFDMRDLKNNAKTKLDSDTKTDDELTDGLYTILGNDSESQDYVFIYDNDGVIRGEIPIIGYRAHRILFRDDKMYFSVGQQTMAEVNNLGKITHLYDLGRYQLHHDYVFDDDGNIVILAGDTKADTCEDMIIRLNLSSGDVDRVLDLGDLFGDMKKKAKLPEGGNSGDDGDGLDWIHLNTIQYLGNDDVIVSSRELSTIIKLDDIFDNPKIDYLIGADEVWKGTKEEKCLLDKKGDFTIQGGQHSVTYQKINNDSYYLYLFDNNIGVSTTRSDIKWKNAGLTNTKGKGGDASHYYKYLVNDKDRTFELVSEFDVPYSGYVSSVQERGDNIIVDSGMACKFGEYTEDGELIKQFDIDCEKFIYRVYKYDFPNLFVD